MLPDDADEVIVQRYARAYILKILGGSVFVDTSGDKVHLIWLKFLEDFDTAGNIVGVLQFWHGCIDSYVTPLRQKQKTLVLP